METMTMLKLKEVLDLTDVVIRYKGFVLAAEFLCGPSDEYWKVAVWQPAETEEETGLDFHELRLENVTEWEGQQFETEGEALMAGMQFIDWRY